jgi:O-antigen/teichoic acid export membrane protein
VSGIKSLIGQTAYYGLSSILGRAINFLLLPFYTKILIPEANGVVTEVYAYVAFFGILYTYGMETTYFRFANKDGETESGLFNKLQSALTITTLCFSTLLFLAAPLIVEWFGPRYKTEYVYLFALILAIDTLFALPFARLRQQKRAARFASVKLIQIGLNIGFNLFFLLYLIKQVPQETNAIWRDQVFYIFLANLVANLSQAPFLIGAFRSWRFSLEKVKGYLHYAFPLLFMGLAGMVNEMLDRIMLREWLPENFYPGQSSLYALGIYGACYKLSMFMSLAIQSFRFAAEPFFFAKAAQGKEAPDVLARVMSAFVLVCAVLFVFISANPTLIGLLLRQEVFREGLAVVPILLLANLFLGIYVNLSMWFKLKELNWYGTLITVIGAVITIGANFYLIPIMGYMGAAWATLICYGAMAILCYRLGQIHFPVPYEALKITIWLLWAAFLVWGLLPTLPSGIWWQELLIACGLTLAFIIPAAYSSYHFILGKKGNLSKLKA